MNRIAKQPLDRAALQGVMSGIAPPHHSRAMILRTLFFASAALLCHLQAQTPPAPAKEITDLLAKAEAGQADAQTIAGVLYEIGRGVAKDDAQAAKWYRKAADQGVAEAQFNLALLYKSGRGVPKDLTEASNWMRKSADQGNAKAQFNLGVMYEKGEGLPKNDVEAIRWFTAAAEQGDATAQLNLGFMFANGQGVKPNDVEAYKWWLIAAAQGQQAAKKNCEILERNLKSTQMLGAQLAARNFRPQKTQAAAKTAQPK